MPLKVQKNLCSCGNPKYIYSRTCRSCYGRSGRSPGVNLLYAIEFGLSKRQVERMGGAEKLRAMPEDARSLLVNMKNDGNARRFRVGGLAARGFVAKRPGRERVERLMSDADFVELGLEAHDAEVTK